MLHKTSRERYDKLKRVFRRLMRNFNVDDLDDFIATANSMPVWMENDPSLNQEQRDALARFTVDRSVDWQICNQIANRQKHVRPKRQGGYALRVDSIHVKHGGLRILPYPRLLIGTGDEISIDYNGAQESALAFVVRTFKVFHYIYEMVPIPPVQRRRFPTFLELAGVGKNLTS